MKTQGEEDRGNSLPRVKGRGMGQTLLQSQHSESRDKGDQTLKAVPVCAGSFRPVEFNKKERPSMCLVEGWYDEVEVGTSAGPR